MVAPANEAAVVQLQMPGRPVSRDAAGIRVEFLSSGGVTLRGTDRWGHALNLSYESATYFRDAVPAVERSLTPGQAAALQGIVHQLQMVPGARN